MNIKSLNCFLPKMVYFYFRDTILHASDGSIVLKQYKCNIILELSEFYIISMLNILLLEVVAFFFVCSDASLFY